MLKPILDWVSGYVSRHHTYLKSAQLAYPVVCVIYKGITMSKGQDSKKNVKKKPLLTAKEKKAAKQAKKDDNGSILGKH